MNFIKLLFELFVVYLLYKFIFELVIPVYKTTQQVKQKMEGMNQQMRQENGHDNGFQNHSTRTERAQKPVADDYIDYEEIR